MLLGGMFLETMMLRRILPTLALCLLLGGCQPPTYDIFAVNKGADLVFEARGSGSWPFRDDDGISAEWLTFRNRDELIWAIERDPGRPGCKPRGDTPPFPLVYGQVPECYRARIAAKLPRQGALHRVDGEGFRDGSGLFMLQDGATNLEWSEVEQEMRDWPALADPRFPPGPGNGQPVLDDDSESGGNDTAPANRQ